MKKRSYKLSLPRWALAQRESWYAELAAARPAGAEGGRNADAFCPAPPARLRYRFEVGSDEGGLPAGQKEFYEECGWQYVLNDRPLHLFWRARTDGRAGPSHRPRRAGRFPQDAAGFDPEPGAGHSAVGAADVRSAHLSGQVYA